MPSTTTYVLLRTASWTQNKAMSLFETGHTYFYFGENFEKFLFFDSVVNIDNIVLIEIHVWNECFAFHTV